MQAVTTIAGQADQTDLARRLAEGLWHILDVEGARCTWQLAERLDMTEPEVQGLIDLLGDRVAQLDGQSGGAWIARFRAARADKPRD